MYEQPDDDRTIIKNISTVELCGSPRAPACRPRRAFELGEGLEAEPAVAEVGGEAELRPRAAGAGLNVKL